MLGWLGSSIHEIYSHENLQEADFVKILSLENLILYSTFIVVLYG